MLKEKCFAMRGGGKCDALNVKRCPNYTACPFYKPAWMAERDTARANQKLQAMPEQKQLRIADKYYNGKMPWRSEV